MPITINGSGTVTGITAGGLPDAIITQPELATGVAGTGPAFSATQTSAQTPTSSTNTKVVFNSETFDTNGNYDPTTNYRFTPTVAGYYQINLVIASAVSSTLSFASIYKNGSSAIRGFQTNATAYNYPASGLLYLNGSTDYVEAYIYMTVGVGLDTSGLSLFSASLVRSA
jgi:hypothetical protein